MNTEELIILTNIENKLSTIVDVLKNKKEKDLETENSDSDSNLCILLEE